MYEYSRRISLRIISLTCFFASCVWFYLKIYLLFHACRSFACLDVCYRSISSAFGGHLIAWNWSYRWFVSHHVCWEPNMSPLKEQPVLLPWSSEQSLQPLMVILRTAVTTGIVNICYLVTTFPNTVCRWLCYWTTFSSYSFINGFVVFYYYCRCIHVCMNADLLLPLSVQVTEQLSEAMSLSASCSEDWA